MELEIRDLKKVTEMHVEGKTVVNRISRRGDAWELGMLGEYNRALEIIEELLRQAPTDIITLRMKGNLLELRALDFAQYHACKLLRSRDYVKARKCYEEILRAEPDNTLALIDLADHYCNLGASTKALENPFFMDDLRRNFRTPRSAGGGDWGDWRVRIYPERGTKRYGRTGFYLHGGYFDGSAGCIDFGGGIFGNDKLLEDLLLDPDKRIPLLVR